MMQVKMKWLDGLKFQGRSTFNHLVVTDVPKKSGGDEAGPKPTELLLFGMASCAGVDVVRIMEKSRQKLESLEIEVTAHQRDEYPKPFHTVELKFVASGKDLDERKLAKAIELSEEKYCVVSQTIANETKVKTSYEVKE